MNPKIFLFSLNLFRLESMSLLGEMSQNLNNLWSEWIQTQMIGLDLYIMSLDLIRLL